MSGPQDSRQSSGPDQPPEGFVCEHCWLEPAERRAPETSGLTWVCAACFTTVAEMTDA